MRRRRRPRRRSARTYTIAYLLSRQPKTLAKQPQYSAMIRQFRSSERLRHLRISRRCYTLLNHARIAPENLHHFYRTYRLPADPFFPLFFAAKRGYLAERRRIKEERHRYILEGMRALPSPVLDAVRYLGYLERNHNAAGRSPVWQEELFPPSKKQVDQYRRYDEGAWFRLFRRHLSLLQSRYRSLTSVTAERVYACLVLELIPACPKNGHGVTARTGARSSASPSVPVPPPVPSAQQVNGSYRRLSMVHHPDRGGNPEVFIELKRARDLLSGPAPG
jgi:hypothetical protein